MRFIPICDSNNDHISNFNVYDTETMIYYPMVSESVAYEICELLNNGVYL